MEALSDSCFKVVEYAFERIEVRFTRIMHIQADLLNSIGDVGASEREVLKSSRKTSV